VVIRYFYRVRVPLSPLEADPPLIIDPDAVLPCPSTFQFFKTVPRGHPQVLKGLGRIEHEQFPQCRSKNLDRQPAGPLSPKESLRVRIAEGLDHLDNISALR